MRTTVSTDACILFASLSFGILYNSLISLKEAIQTIKRQELGINKLIPQSKVK